jgi:glycosyltransferase involved in cell wall biosynthesis
MRLMLDCRLSFGVGTILRNIAPFLAKELQQLIILCNDERAWKDIPNVRVESFNAKLYGVNEQIQFPYHLRKHVDLLHVPNFNIPLAWRRPLVVTINDLAHLSPAMAASALQKTYVRFFVKRCIEAAGRILTLSEFSRRELVREFSIPRDRIIVGYCGVDRNLFKPVEGCAKKDVYSRLGIERPFVLSVASLRPHKNVNTVLRAFHQLKVQKRIPHDLVLVGTQKGFRITAGLTDLPGETAKYIKHFDFVDERTLAELYSCCDVFVYPSLYEGFGLPPLEAMSCGAPVIVSNRASLPEVVGNAGPTIDALDISTWVEEIARIANDATLQAELSQRSVQQAQLFSWEALARIYLTCYRECLA